MLVWEKYTFIHISVTCHEHNWDDIPYVFCIYLHSFFCTPIYFSFFLVYYFPLLYQTPTLYESDSINFSRSSSLTTSLQKRCQHTESIPLWFPLSFHPYDSAYIYSAVPLLPAEYPSLPLLATPLLLFPLNFLSSPASPLINLQPALVLLSLTHTIIPFPPYLPFPSLSSLSLPPSLSPPEEQLVLHHLLTSLLSQFLDVFYSSPSPPPPAHHRLSPFSFLYLHPNTISV